MSSYADKYNPSGASSLVRKIYRACRVSLAEPDLSLNLAVADYINDKQSGTPREAAITIVNLINSKDSHTAIFALALLDVLVKNCGYPFHLQISRKEFLNELVKRFPERPPTRYSKVQRLILGAIEEWNQTICKTSRYKGDLGFIRDMHRLLSYKGYSFPEVKAEDASVLNPSDNLKSIEEIQKEEQIAQSAKLQELVRRGRPQDLKEANKLMKIMAGFKDDNLVESRAKVAEDLDKLKRKCEIFKEMLDASNNRIDETDETLIELFSALKVSQPKIQKIIGEEADDEQAVQDLLKLNDLVNTLINRYNQARGLPSSSSSSAPQSSASQDLLNLIDFDDNSTPTTTTTNNDNNNNTLDDLLGDLTSLNFNSTPSTQFGLGGDISLSSPSPPISSPNVNQPNYDIFNQLSSGSTITPTQTAAPVPSYNNNNNNFGDLLGLSSPTQTTTAPVSNTTNVTVNQSGHLKFDLQYKRNGSNQLEAKALFSNLSPSAISNFQFLIAVPKQFKLSLEPQSGNFLPSFGSNAIHQVFRIDGEGQAKIKWKLNYSFNGSPIEESNTFVFNS